MAENAGGFSRLKNGVIYNDEKLLPKSSIQLFGKKKLEYLNEILSENKIEPIPWITRRYRPYEKLKEKGEDWYKHLKI